jgi:hypothetical protein
LFIKIDETGRKGTEDEKDDGQAQQEPVLQADIVLSGVFAVFHFPVPQKTICSNISIESFPPSGVNICMQCILKYAHPLLLCASPSPIYNRSIIISIRNKTI